MKWPPWNQIMYMPGCSAKGIETCNMQHMSVDRYVCLVSTAQLGCTHTNSSVYAAHLLLPSTAAAEQLAGQEYTAIVPLHSTSITCSWRHVCEVEPTLLIQCHDICPQAATCTLKVDSPVRCVRIFHVNIQERQQLRHYLADQ